MKTEYIHFFSLLTVLILTIYFILRLRVKSTKKKVIINFVIFSILSLFIYGSFAHMCNSGMPEHQVSIPIFCACIINIWIKHKIKFLVIIFYIGLSIFLGHNYTDFVHKGKFTGNTQIDNIYEGVRKSDLTSYRVAFALYYAKSKDDNSYNAGWVEDLPFYKKLLEINEIKNDLTSPKITIEAKWFTFLTGLYLKNEITYNLWYPGGKISDSYEKLSLRKK